VNSNELRLPPGFGLRQSSGAFDTNQDGKSGRGLPQSKTLPRAFTVPMRDFGIDEALYGAPTGSRLYRRLAIGGTAD
jgi:hypothetical protein